jgi:2-oxoisovalerate dehydrogenase E1 component
LSFQARKTYYQRMQSNTSASLDREALLALYKKMIEIRKCEERLIKSFNAGLIYGGCHTYIGEEAIAPAVSAHLRKDDFVFGTHRGHGHALSKGLEPLELFAELYGRSGGTSGGRGGSMHLFKPEIGLMGTNGIVGPSILLASGAAYAFKLRRQDRVAVAYFGDGASNNGAFHEGCNMATKWELPVIFVCENNLYATEVAYSSVTKQTSVAKKADAYGLRNFVVDGNDVLEVYDRAGAAIEAARTGKGPTLLECKTYRHRSHSEGMSESGYRPKEELAEWKKRDPIKLFAEYLKSKSMASAEELSAIDQETAKRIDAANAEALKSPEPDSSREFDHVFAETSGAAHA